LLEQAGFLRDAGAVGAAPGGPVAGAGRELGRGGLGGGQKGQGCEGGCEALGELHEGLLEGWFRRGGRTASAGGRLLMKHQEAGRVSPGAYRAAAPPPVRSHRRNVLSPPADSAHRPSVPRKTAPTCPRR